MSSAKELFTKINNASASSHPLSALNLTGEFLAKDYNIEWNEEKIYFPFEIGDQTTIAENQRVSKIKLKKRSTFIMLLMVQKPR